MLASQKLSLHPSCSLRSRRNNMYIENKNQVAHVEYSNFSTSQTPNYFLSYMTVHGLSFQCIYISELSVRPFQGHSFREPKDKGKSRMCQSSRSSADDNVSATMGCCCQITKTFTSRCQRKCFGIPATKPLVHTADDPVFLSSAPRYEDATTELALHV
jgi:hypothetical protein